MKRLEITESLRRCTADGRKAIFHRWRDVSQIVPPSPMMGGHGGGVVRDTFAIVEYEDGSIWSIAPERTKQFQRYVNNRIIFRTVERFEDYNGSRYK